MPLATFVFRLPEEEDEFRMFQDASKIHCGLGEVWNKVRSKLKYEDIPEEQAKAYRQVRSWLIEACNEWGFELP